MFSESIHIRTQDGHSIFDVRTRKNINSTEEIQKCGVIIGDHVWMGIHSTLLQGTTIGNGSIIGAYSLVKGKIPNNCIVAGVPGKVIRRDVAWCMKNASNDILDCGEEYINLTEE